MRSGGEVDRDGWVQGMKKTHLWLSMAGKVLHLERAVLASNAALRSRCPTGYKEVTAKPVLIRECWKLVNRKKKNHGQVWWCEKYYVQVCKGLRDYGTDKSRPRGFIVGTNCRFFKRKFKDGEPVMYDCETVYGYEFPLTPCYQEDDSPQKRPAMRIELGTKLVGGERVGALFYLSAVLAYCYGERSACSCDSIQFIGTGEM